MTWAVIQKVLGSIGQMLLGSIFDALTNTATNLLTNAISGLLDNVAEAFSGLKGPLQFIGDAVSDFTDNLADELNGQVAAAIGGVNKFAQKATGVIDAQQRLHEQLTGITQGLLDGLNSNLRKEETRTERTGAVLSDFLLQFVKGKRKEMEIFADTMASWQAEQVGGDAALVISGSESFYSYLNNYILNDIALVEGIPRKDLDNVSAYMLEFIKNSGDRFEEWFRETVVKPIANYNAMVAALKAGFSLSEEEMKEGLDTLEKVTYERLVEKVKKGEIAPGYRLSEIPR